MSKDDPHDPLIFFARENGKLGLCLSYAGKWLTGIGATLVTTGALSSFGLLWTSVMNSTEALRDIRAIEAKVDRLDQATNARLDRYEERLRELERSET